MSDTNNLWNNTQKLNNLESKMNLLINIVSSLDETIKNIEKKTSEEINQIKRDIEIQNFSKNLNKSQNLPNLNSINKNLNDISKEHSEEEK